MVLISAFLEIVPDAIKDAMDQDTLEYLGDMIADESDPAAIREATEPFLVDAGMSENELDSMFSNLNIDATNKGKAAESSSSSILPSTLDGPADAVATTTTKLPQPLALKDGTFKPTSISETSASNISQKPAAS
ncbi:hypothetical protein FB639_005572, partial [Coemansia asiatica]